MSKLKFSSQLLSFFFLFTSMQAHAMPPPVFETAITEFGVEEEDDEDASLNLVSRLPLYRDTEVATQAHALKENLDKTVEDRGTDRATDLSRMTDEFVTLTMLRAGVEIPEIPESFAGRESLIIPSLHIHFTGIRDEEIKMRELAIKIQAYGAHPLLISDSAFQREQEAAQKIIEEALLYIVFGSYELMYRRTVTDPTTSFSEADLPGWVRSLQELYLIFTKIRHEFHAVESKLHCSRRLRFPPDLTPLRQTLALLTSDPYL